VRDHARMNSQIDTEQIEFGRFDELERRFGIRRSTAYELINAGKIKSVAVKKKGTRSGIRLIDFGSVREFLRNA
jgi:Helix-turn-helix domain